MVLACACAEHRACQTQELSTRIVLDTETGIGKKKKGRSRNKWMNAVRKDVSN